MEVIVVEGAEEQAVIVADACERLLSRKPEALLGLATGSSPVSIYAELVRRHEQQGLSFARAGACLLDEYLGLPENHDELYRATIRRVLLDGIDLALERLWVPDVQSSDLTAACVEYEACLERAGGVDLQLLGIGSDGHIGFNEPGSPLDSRTRIKALTEATRRDNARYFDGDVGAVPTHAITQGIGTILEARHLVLVAQGESKAAILAAAIEGPVTSSLPASALQGHPHATFVIDSAAASQLGGLPGIPRQHTASDTFLPATRARDLIPLLRDRSAQRRLKNSGDR